MNITSWTKEFADEIYESGVPNTWRLYVDESLLKNRDAKYFSQKTFGRFQCFHCKLTWTSSKVFILFCMTQSTYQNHGNVTMRIFNQECRLCNMMKEPRIPSENIKIVISNVVGHIQRVFYGGKNVNEDRPPSVYGKMEGPHDEEHCEACKLDLCSRETMPSEESSVLEGVLGALVLGVGLLAAFTQSKK